MAVAGWSLGEEPNPIHSRLIVLDESI